MKIFEEGSTRREHQYYYDAEITKPTIVLNNTMRTEDEYYLDPRPDEAAYAAIKYLIDKFSQNAYLVIASEDVSKQSNVRTKKFSITNNKYFSQLDRIDKEITINDEKTRLISVVDIRSYQHSVGNSKILNWRYGFIILSDLDINVVGQLTENWVEQELFNVLAFNYENIVNEINDLESTIVLRYFPPDNALNETISLIGKDSVITDKFCS